MKSGLFGAPRCKSGKGNSRPAVSVRPWLESLEDGWCRL